MFDAGIVLISVFALLRFSSLREQKMDSGIVAVIAVGLSIAGLVYLARQRSGARNETPKVGGPLQSVFSLIADYGNVMAAKTSVCRDESELPAPKQKIEQAILLALKQSNLTEEYRNGLVMAYSNLSEFQSLSEADRHAVEKWDAAIDGDLSQLDKIATDISSAGEAVERLTQLTRREFDRRREYLRTQGYVIE